MKAESKAQQLQEVIEQLLLLVGEDPSRDGLMKTPERVAKMFNFLTKGYTQDID